MLGAILLGLASLIATAIGAAPQWAWRGACGLLGLACAAALTAMLSGSAERSLEVVFSHPAFVANQVQDKDFMIETTSAPAWAWGAAAAVFCAALGTLAGRAAPQRRPWTWVFAFGWLGIALALALEKLAAPPATVAFRLDSTLWASSLVAALVLARTEPSLARFGMRLVLLVTALRLPVAVFGTLATWYHWGTSLDVHSVEFCAHPLAQSPMTLEPGSLQQLWYLVWASQLLVFPALTSASVGGIGFLALMARRAAQAPPASAASR